jgi:hypothetical protein
MKAQLMLFSIAIVFFCSIIGCGAQLDTFNDVRDFIFDEAGTSFRTTLELAVNTDNLGIIRNHVRDIDFDTDDFSVSDIEKLEIGVYRLQDGATVRLTDEFHLVDVEKMTRRLKRAGYDTVIRSSSDSEVSLGLIKETRGSKKGAGYFIQLKPDQFVLVKVDAQFTKL